VEDDRLLTDLTIVAGRFVRRVTREVNPPEDVADWRGLAIVDQYQPVTIGGLARAYGCSQPAATKIVNRLAAKGAVQRAASASDGRVSKVSLTDEGRERLIHLRDMAETALEPHAKSWSDADKEAVRRTIELLTDMVEEAAEQGARRRG
jgi:DNA-binding MarR family transcriptional regulator